MTTMMMMMTMTMSLVVTNDADVAHAVPTYCHRREL